MLLLLLIATLRTWGWSAQYRRNQRMWRNALAKCGTEATCQCKPDLRPRWQETRNGMIKVQPKNKGKTTFKQSSYCRQWNCSCPPGMKTVYKTCEAPRPAASWYRRPDQKMKKECLQDASCKKDFDNPMPIYLQTIQKTIDQFDRYYQGYVKDLAKLTKNKSSKWRIAGLKSNMKWNRSTIKFYQDKMEKAKKKVFKPSRRYKGMTLPQYKVVGAWSEKNRDKIYKEWQSKSKKAKCSCARKKYNPRCTNYGKLLYNTCGCSNSGSLTSPRPSGPSTGRPTAQ